MYPMVSKSSDFFCVRNLINNQLLTVVFHPTKVAIFIGVIFNIVPYPFYQCLINIVFDAGQHVYTPVAWVLMTGQRRKCLMDI